MDIVVPILASDLDRYLVLQRPTFQRYYRDLDTTFLVTRPDHLAEVRARTRHLPGVEVRNEQEIAPELRWLRIVRRRPGRDWHVQQLVKLASVAAARSDFVLVLDADVIAVRDVSDDDLVRDGRALRPKEREEEDHPTWIEMAGTALGVEPLDYSASVTPSVLARAAVLELAEYVRRNVRPRRPSLRLIAGAPIPGNPLRTWRGRLLSVNPWTEYQVYDTYLVRAGSFDRFHVYSDDPVLYGNSLWVKGQFDDWDPRPLADGPRYFFTVAQGYLGIPVDALAARLHDAGIFL
jgi:hypothetical protein